MKCLACDFGGSSVKYALVDDKANITEQGKLSAPLESLEQFQDTVENLYNRFKDDIEGISISIPGYIDPNNGFLFESGPYTHLYNKSVADVLMERCPVDIVAENDGKCAALSEVWKGALKDVQNGAVIVLGSGVAGGIINNRRVHWGKGFTAGELSYMLTRNDTHSLMDMAMTHIGMYGLTYKICKYKNLDFSVQDSSAIINFFDQILADQFPKSVGEPKKIKADGYQIFKWLDEGDPDVVRVYKEFIESLAMMIFNIQILYAPEKVVIGGGLSRKDIIFKDVEEELNRYYGEGLISGQLKAEIVQSVYLDECNLCGAAYNYFTRFGNNCM